MPTRYAQLPVGPDSNTPRVTDTELAQAVAGHPEAVNTRPYTSAIADRTRRPRPSNTGGTR